MDQAVGWIIAAITAVGSIIFGVKKSKTDEQTGLATRLAKVEDDHSKLTARVQMLERREVWHERKEGILTDALRENDIAVPEMPPAPEAWVA